MKLTEQQISVIMKGQEYLPMGCTDMTLGQLLDALQTANYSELFSTTDQHPESQISIRLWSLGVKIVALTATDEDLRELYRLLTIRNREMNLGP